MILISSLTLLFIITVGYAAFQTNINITAKGNILEKGITISELKNKVVTSGDGLYKDTYESGRYVYKGANPDNYITFNNEQCRIISIETDGTLKIMKKDSISSMAWNLTKADNWARPADLNTYLNSTTDANSYYNKLSSDAKGLIQKHIWEIGQVEVYNTDLAAQIQAEKGTTWNGNIGLISVSDAIRANTNIEQCGTMKLHFDNKLLCKTTNYIVPTSGYLWTISSRANIEGHVFRVNSDGNLSSNAGSDDYSGVAPVLYLKSNITLTGQGTETNSYNIKK